MMRKQTRVAILDMNAGHPNLGLQSIVDLVSNFEEDLEFKVFEVRVKAEVPDMDFDIYIASGGPGSPLDKGEGELKFYEFLEKLWNWNKVEAHPKKHALFICHSFQMACHFFKIGKIKERYSPSFGIFPTHKTAEGKVEPLFKNLPDPFYIADFRSWQVLQPNDEKLEEMEGAVLTIEKERPDVKRERAIMAVRFSPEFVGTQFHPEAHPEGMFEYFSKDAKKNEVISNHGRDKYAQMIADMQHPGRVGLTHKTVIPNFLRQSLAKMNQHSLSV